MLTTITKCVNWTILVAFICCFSYQAVYLWAVWRKKLPPHVLATPQKYAVLIAARNEEAVIGRLIDSIKEQNYPKELIDVFVVADNCSDSTADIARMKGAEVYVRHNTTLVGKGYALQFLLAEINKAGRMKDYDGFFIFDADNTLDRNYVREMNRTFSDGYRIVTSYRNSSNFGANWITSGYALWFLHDSQFLNKGRMLTGNSCMVSGTGYLIGREILERSGGWNYFLLTEDIEFTADCIVNGEKIGYCERAMFYDEQPTNFLDSWRQRQRWIKGYFQVYRKYGGKLIRKLGGGNRFSCYDMLMANLPAFVLISVSVAACAVLMVAGAITGQDISFVFMSVGRALLGMIAGMFVVGAYTMYTERKKINIPAYKKIGYLFTFPFYMLTYIPISYSALKRKVEWKPIRHGYAAERSRVRRTERLGRLASFSRADSGSGMQDGGCVVRYRTQK